jgi:hypothetical protein
MNKRIVFMVVSVFLMFFLAAEAFGQARVKLNLDSNVRGAEVYMDGRRIGQIPFSGQVPSGRHQLKVTARGYKDAVQTMTLRSDTTLTMTLEKEQGRDTSPPDNNRGFALKVNSNVRGAKIFIDNRLRGETPETIKLMRGRINIKVTAAGYVDFVTTLNISDDTTINAELKKLERLFNLGVSANIRGAKVYVDDKYLGAAPVRRKLSEGEHVVKVTAPGFEDYVENVNLSRDHNVVARMERIRRFFTLSILSDVPDARVWINNEAQSGGTPLTIKLEEGTYKVKVQARRTRPYETSIRLTRDTTIKADLVPDNAKIQVIIPDEIARIDRSWRGQRIIVYLDGRPQKGFSFETTRGRHTVRVQVGSWHVDQQINCREGNTYVLRPMFTMEVTEEDN